MTDGTPGAAQRPSPGHATAEHTPPTMAASPRPVAPTRLALLTALALGFAALAGIAVGAVAWLSLARPRRPRPAATAAPTSGRSRRRPEGHGPRHARSARSSPRPPLRLTDQDGRPFDLASLRGEPVLVFFGYTHCPDVCPTNLADVRDALKLVDEEVGVVFVTIDPARDDAAAMKQYVDYYQAGYIGLTGTDDEIRAVADAWGVSYAKVESTAAVRLRDGPHRRHVPRRRGGPAAPPDLVRGRTGGHRRPDQRPRDRGARDAGSDRCADGPRRRLPTPTATPPPRPRAAHGAAPTPDARRTVRVRLQSTIVRAGPNRIVVTVSDPANRELAKPDVVASFAFRSTDDPRWRPIEVPGHVHLGGAGRQGRLRRRDDAAACRPVHTPRSPSTAPTAASARPTSR